MTGSKTLPRPMPRVPASEPLSPLLLPSPLTSQLHRKAFASSCRSLTPGEFLVLCAMAGG